MLWNCGVGSRLLRVPWTARRSNQSTLKEINPGCSLEGLMLKLKFQYFGHLMRRADSFAKTVNVGKVEGRRRKRRQRMRWLDGITNSRSLPKPMSIEFMMPSNHLILCHPLLLLPSIFPSTRVFSMSQLFASGGQSIEGSASTSVLPMNTQDQSPLG